MCFFVGRLCAQDFARLYQFVNDLHISARSTCAQLDASKIGMKVGRIKDPSYTKSCFGNTPPTFILPLEPFVTQLGVEASSVSDSFAGSVSPHVRIAKCQSLAAVSWWMLIWNLKTSA